MAGKPTKDQGCVKAPRCERIGTSTPATTVVGGAPIGGAGKGVVGVRTTSTSRKTSRTRSLNQARNR